MASKPQLSTITFCRMRPCIRIEIYALLEYVAVQKDTKDSKTPAKAQYPVRCVVTCVRPAIPSRRALLQPPANPPRNGVRAHSAAVRTVAQHQDDVVLLRTISMPLKTLPLRYRRLVERSRHPRCQSAFDTAPPAKRGSSSLVESSLVESSRQAHP